MSFDLHIQEGDVVVVVELRVEAADGAILARDREQPVEGVRDEHVVKAEVLGFVRNRDESAAVEAARSSTRGSGWASRGPASSWECRAAQSRQARSEEAQEPS